MEQIDLKQLVEQYPEVLTDGTKTIVIPEITPGRERGKITFLNFVNEFEPKSSAASSRDLSSFDITE